MGTVYMYISDSQLLAPELIETGFGQSDINLIRTHSSQLVLKCIKAKE